MPQVHRSMGTIGSKLSPLKSEKGIFLLLKLMDKDKKLLSENFYWLPDKDGEYTGLQEIKSVALEFSVEKSIQHQLNLKLKNPSSQNPVSFFNRISVIDRNTNKRVLPVFYSDNYISIVPGEEKTI